MTSRVYQGSYGVALPVELPKQEAEGGFRETGRDLGFHTLYPSLIDPYAGSMALEGEDTFPRPQSDTKDSPKPLNRKEKRDLFLRGKVQ